MLTDVRYMDKPDLLKSSRVWGCKNFQCIEGAITQIQQNSRVREKKGISS